MFEDPNGPLVWTSLLIDHLITVNKKTKKDYLLALTEVDDEKSDKEGAKKLILAIINPTKETDRLHYEFPLVDYVPNHIVLEATASKLLMSSMNIYLKAKENEQRTKQIN